MELKDLLYVLCEYTNVEVYNLEFKLLAFYDGRNSIPAELNDYKIFRVYVDENILKIVINTQK